MKPLVIYHANCTDGFGAAFAAWLKLGDGAEYLPMEYGATYNFDLSGVVVNHVGYEINEREVFILDFSFPREVMEDIFVHAKRVVWLDHHKTAFEMWLGSMPQHGQYVIGTGHTVWLDNNKSGAMLAWEYFHPGKEVPRLIKHIDDRDRWQFNLYGSKEFHAALASYKPWTFDMWQTLLHETHAPYGGASSYLTDFLNQGHAILRAHNQNVQAALKQACLCQIVKPGRQRGTRVEPPWSHRVSGPNHLGYFDEAYVSGLAANAPSFLASDLGHELANKSGTFGLVWSMAGDGQVHCSLRSNGEYDVSAIAKTFGGGGHRNAAGFSTDINTLLEWLK